jgi:GDP-4-dehydro-6-deoxy-D-mannose reductase
MRALVVGAAGFVGQYLVRHLVDQGDEVVGSSVDGIVPGPLHGTAKLDITSADDCADLIRRVRPDVVYHLAGVSFVPEAEADFSKTLAVNVGGTANLVRQCHLLKMPLTFLFVSSAEVYGHVATEELPIREQQEVRPANNYSLSKRMAELVVERYARHGSFRSVIARPFNHIGAGQDPRFVVSNFARQLACIARGLVPPVMEVGNLEARRDFSDVRDVVRAYRMLATNGSGVYNLGSGVGRSIQSVLDALISIAGVKVEVRQDPGRMRGPEVVELRACTERVRRGCGWEPQVEFEDSLREIYQYWLTSPQIML